MTNVRISLGKNLGVGTLFECATLHIRDVQNTFQLSQTISRSCFRKTCGSFAPGGLRVN